MTNFTVKSILTVLAVFAAAPTLAIERTIDIQFESPLLAQRGTTEISFMDLHGRMQAIPEGDRAGVVSSPERLEQLIQDVLTIHALAEAGRADGLAESDDFKAELHHMMIVRLAEQYRENRVESQVLESYESQARETFLLNRDQFTTPDTVTFSHLLVRNFRDDAQGKAERLFAELADGADFAALARAHSDDPSVVQNNGTLEGVDISTLDPQFAAGLDSLEAGQTGLVESQFGWHVVRVEGRTAGGPLAFEDVRDQLEREAEARHREQLFDRVMRQAYEGELELSEGAVAEILERYPPPQELIDAVNRGG